MHGVLNVLKPPGPTSHDVVSFVRRTLGIKRVGHTGTLDPAASGVLPVCVGQATRLVEYLQAGTKEYIAEATFGFETDSGDAVGNTIAQSDATQVSLENLRAVLDHFRGEITQTPPIFSAIKKDGKKLYELAREGTDENDFEIPTRQVVISDLRITHFSREETKAPRAMLHIECSGGTYIRSLVRDIGRAPNTHATMTFLVRTRSGAFLMEDARTLEEIANSQESALMPMSEVLSFCAAHIVEDDAAMTKFLHGKTAPLNYNRAQLEQYISDPESLKIRKTKAMYSGANLAVNRVAVINRAKTAAAIACPIEGEAMLFKPEKVFPLD